MSRITINALVLFGIWNKIIIITLLFNGNKYRAISANDSKMLSRLFKRARQDTNDAPKNVQQICKLVIGNH